MPARSLAFLAAAGRNDDREAADYGTSDHVRTWRAVARTGPGRRRALPGMWLLQRVVWRWGPAG